MKPMIAMASMMLGTASMGTVVYLASNPNAFLTHTPQVRHRIASSALPVVVTRTNAAPAVPTVIEIAPIRITGSSSVGTKARTRSNEESVKSESAVLTACSDWRPLGPAATDSERVSAEHQVKLLCPAGGNARDTFMVGMQDPGARRLR